MVRAVLFDFGGVLANEGFQEWISKNIAPYSQIANDISELEKKVNQGDLPASAYNEALANKSHKNPSDVQNELLNGYMMQTHVIDIALLLRKNHITIGILSNFPKAWFDILRERFRLDAIFDKIFVSSEMHLVKPEKDIFEKVLADLAIKSEETVFIDDKKPAVTMANSLGMHGILYTNPEELRQSLILLQLPL